MCANSPLRTDKLLAWKYLDSCTRRHDGNDVLSKVEYHVTRMRSLFEGDVWPVSSDSTVTLDTSLNNQSIQAADRYRQAFCSKEMSVYRYEDCHSIKIG